MYSMTVSLVALTRTNFGIYSIHQGSSCVWILFCLFVLFCIVFPFRIIFFTFYFLFFRFFNLGIPALCKEDKINWKIFIPIVELKLVYRANNLSFDTFICAGFGKRWASPVASELTCLGLETSLPQCLSSCRSMMNIVCCWYGVH